MVGLAIYLTMLASLPRAGRGLVARAPGGLGGLGLHQSRTQSPTALCGIKNPLRSFNEWRKRDYDAEVLQEAKELISAGEAILVDVREQAEYDWVHFANATLCPLSSLERLKRPDLPKDTRIFLHCQAGIRVWPASDLLSKMGYRDVTPLNSHFEEIAELFEFAYPPGQRPPDEPKEEVVDDDGNVVSR